jgi:hypothetical protein
MMSRSSRRNVGFGRLTAGVTLAVSLAACAAGSGAQGSPSTPTPTTTPTTTSSGQSPCTSSQLALSLSGQQGAAGSQLSNFVLTNTSDRQCTLLGYPGVSYLDASQGAVGQPAGRTVTGGQPSVVVLSPRGVAHFVVQNSHVAPQPGCESLGSAASIKVYPPDQTTALAASAPSADGFLVCNPVVTPIRVGAGGD